MIDADAGQTGAHANAHVGATARNLVQRTEGGGGNGGMPDVRIGDQAPDADIGCYECAQSLKLIRVPEQGNIGYAQTAYADFVNDAGKPQQFINGDHGAEFYLDFHLPLPWDLNSMECAGGVVPNTG